MVDFETEAALDMLERQFFQDVQSAINGLAHAIQLANPRFEPQARALARFALMGVIIHIFIPNPPQVLLDYWGEKIKELGISDRDIKRATGQILVQYDYSFREFLQSDIQVAVDPSILGSLIENTQSGANREAKGIFFTPRVEIEFMCKLALLQYLKTHTNLQPAQIISLLFGQETLSEVKVNELEGVLDEIRILDPTCGSGAFILGMLHELVQIHVKLAKSLGNLPNQAEIKLHIIIRNLFGIDVSEEAILVTKTRLFIAIQCEHEESGFNLVENITQVLDEHFLSGDCIVKARNFFSEDFDIIIGNPPYVQHTRIAPPLVNSPTKVQKSAYIQQIKDVVRTDWNGLVEFRGQVDYLVYFFLKGLKLLKTSGILCFITSSTWLDAELGLRFKEFLVHHVKLLQFFDSVAQKSFRSANINTTISVFEKPDEVFDPMNHFVYFCLLKRSFSECLAAAPFAQFSQISASADKDWVKITQVAQISLVESQATALSPTLTALQNRWGMKYLKYFGPFASALDQSSARESFTPLATLASATRGFTSGANEFFYLPENVWQKWQIEDQFLVPLLKSPRELSTIRISPSTPLSFRIFFCQKPKEELSGTNALLYIEECGETAEVTLKGAHVVGFQNSETCLARALWYALPTHRPAPIVIQKGFADRFATYENEALFLVDQTFYEIFPLEPAYVEPLIAVMNSTIGIFELLRISTTGLGGGLYRPTVNEIRTLLIPDIRLMPHLHLSAEMKERPINSIYEECGLDPRYPLQEQTPSPLPDRYTLDEEVLNSIGLSPSILPDLYHSVCSLVRDRMQKATRKFPQS
ncbi:MAG TPA: DNA methyltransferase [Candidatus Lokiarchaeia archaeon]|nr:DNA methyltransferase [Candidatus Lokiarchaeia archaeon]